MAFRLFFLLVLKGIEKGFGLAELRFKEDDGTSFFLKLNVETFGKLFSFMKLLPREIQLYLLGGITVILDFNFFLGGSLIFLKFNFELIDGSSKCGVIIGKLIVLLKEDLILSIF